MSENEKQCPESPETDQLMEADRHHWEGEEYVSITAYMRMFAMARCMEEERNARPAPDGCVVLRVAQIVEDWQNRDFEGDTLDETIESAWEMSKAVIRETMQGSDTDTEPKHS